MASFSLRHRAVCDEGDLKGAWHADIDDALAEAADHQEQHHDHSIQIITEQKMTMKYVG